MTSCSFIWFYKHRKANSNIQEKSFDKVKFFNILQSADYSLAQNSLTNQRPACALIEIDGKEAGYMQIMEIGLCKNLIHALILDRGPIWYKGYGSEKHFEAFLRAFKKEFPKRFGRRVRLIPEMPASEHLHQTLLREGFKPSHSKPYQTAWIDLTQSAETLKQNLKKNWRGSLKKAQDTGLAIQWDNKGEHLSWLLKGYIEDRAAKGYDGPSVKLISAMSKTFGAHKNIIIGRALHKDQPIGGILLFTHRPGATYQLGWTSDLGRQKCAHHKLLWDALLELKNRNIKALDLGGMNDETAKGVKKFKQGMGGKEITLPGLYTY